MRPCALLASDGCINNDKLSSGLGGINLSSCSSLRHYCNAEKLVMHQRWLCSQVLLTSLPSCLCAGAD